MNEPKELTVCDVCGNDQLVNSINLGLHPLQDDLVPIGDPRVCERYPTEQVFCDTCKTSHMKYQLPKRTLFTPEYTHRSSQTQDVLIGMKDLVDGVEKRYGSIVDRTVWDIGCNDGSLLDEFRARGANTVGVEPTNAALDAQSKRHDVVQRFFDGATAHRLLAWTGRKPDVITFTNVFAHIEDLQGLIEALKMCLKDETVLVIENHYLGSVIERDQFDTFFHEHLRTYSYTSFTYIAKALGMYVDSVTFPPRYGGNIRVYLKRGERVHPGFYVGESENDFAFGLARLHQRVGWWKKAKKTQLTTLTDLHGVGCAPIGAVALPARAPLLFTLLDLTPNQISAVYQIEGSNKIGHYVPGTRIPIVSDATYDFSSQTGPLLNMAWHIAPEVEARWAAKGYRGLFINVIDPHDFDAD